MPTRYTYIAFDHLMAAEELRATHAFQARTDLLLRPLLHLTIEQIVDGVSDESFVAEHTTGKSFYTEISYLLVSMECLIGAAYTKQVSAAGLAGTPRPSIGRLDAAFADWRIGRFSHQAQLWVDRHFALDCTLKSLEKGFSTAGRATPCVPLVSSSKTPPPTLPSEDAALLAVEYTRWNASDSWEFINAADPCGT